MFYRFIVFKVHKIGGEIKLYYYVSKLANYIITLIKRFEF